MPLPNWKKFINLFGGDYLSRHGILGKDKWTVVGEKLCLNEELGYVCHYITISNSSGKQYELLLPKKVYDPEWCYNEVIDKVSNTLDQTKETVKKRVKRAGMICALLDDCRKRLF